MINIEIIIKPEKTAITNGFSQGASLINTISSSALKLNILDYGAGRLRNAKYLIKLGYKVSILDTETQLETIAKEDKLLFDNIYSTNDSLPKNHFDIILCSYVLNVIPDYQDRVTALKNIEKALSYYGICILEVRGEKALNTTKTKEEYKDGYLVGRGKIRTFQKPYPMLELNEFININTELNILKSIKNGDNIILFLRKIKKS